MVPIHDFPRAFRPLWAVSLVVFSLWAPELRGQNIKASLTGQLTDSQGAAIAGGRVAVRSAGTAWSREVHTDAAGRFAVAALDAGSYLVEAEREGFTAWRSAPLDLRVGDSVYLEIVLHPAGIQTQVEVREAFSLLPRDESKLGRNFTGEEMNGLPVQAGGTGRNFYAQALTAPGVALSTQAHRPFAVSGQRPRNNNYLIDSVEQNDANSGFIAGRGVTEQLISQEAVASFEVITHNFKAEYGRNSGAVVSLVSKSGADAFHGSLFEYHNNSALSARNFFETRRTPQRSNLAGVTVGGPVKKEKAYFFANYETFRPRGSTLATFQTLTAAERARAVPAVRPLVDLYPRSPDDQRVLPTAVPRAVNQHTYLVRGDLILSPAQTLMLRTNYTDGVTDTTGIGNTVASGVSIHNQTRSAAAHHTWVLAPALVNEMRLGYTRQTEDDTFLDSPFLGDPAVNGEVGFLIVPGLSPGGALGFLGRKNFQNNYQWSDDLSWTRGAHTLKFGSSLRRIQVNGGAETSGFRGQLFFPNIGAFLAGEPTSYTRNLGNPMLGLRRTEWHGYAQDDWRIASRLTLNLGLRYEWYSAPGEAADRIPEAFLFRGDNNNFAPRIGLAWSPAGNTVVRAGYGLFYNALEIAFLGLTRFNPPLFEALSVFRPGFPNLLDRANRTTPTGLVIPDQRSRAPYAQHFTLAVDRELWNPGSALSVAYVGTSGTKLPRTRRPNGGENMPQVERPDPAVGVVNRLETSASSIYHGLQASFRQQAGRDLTLRLAYTLSRFIDDVSEFANTNQRLERNIVPIEETDLRLDRAVSDFHIPQVFTAAWSYRLPVWRAHRWLGGWNLAGISMLQSGRPLTLYSGTNNRGGTDNNRILDLPASIERAYHSAVPFRLAPDVTAAMLSPAAGALGTLGRNTERTDTLLQSNLSISKDFALTERIRLQTRGEIFNLFNTTNFDLVDTVLTSPAFGRAISAFGPRSAQLALRLEF